MPFRPAWAVLLVAAVATAAPPPLTLDPEMRTPYTWRVILTVRPHPTLGPAVKRQFIADLKASLGPALGDELGSVEIIDLADVPKEKWEPLWVRFADKGWAAVEGEEFRTLTGVKTHFLTLAAANGRFTLESRQHCGSTGLPSPQVRTKTETDPEKLSRTAGLMLAADFGTVASVEPLPEQTEACLIRVRGGELAGADRWLKVGDVYQFAVVQDAPRPPKKDAPVVAPRPGQVLTVPTDRKATPQPFTLLRVSEIVQPGVAKCDIFTKYETPFVRTRYVVGYRALKVGTREGRVSVRVNDAAGQPPPPAAPLQVWATEFSGRVKPNDRDLLDRRGDLFSSLKTAQGVAMVTVKLGSGKHEYYPVPVLDHGEPARLRFGFDEVAVRKARYEDTVLRFYNRVIDARLAQDELYRAMAALIDKDEYKAAADRGTAGLERLKAEEARLTQEMDELRKEPDAKEPVPAGAFAAADRLLGGIRTAVPELGEKVEELQNTLAKADDPVAFEKKLRAKDLNGRIATHLGRGEVPEALDLYDRLIELTNQDDIRERKKKLVEEWKVKSDEHAALRNYLTGQWAKMSTRDEYDAAVPKLRQTVDGLAKLDDRLGLRLAAGLIDTAYVRLNDLLPNLDATFSEDREKIQAIKKTLDALQKVDSAVQSELKRLEPAKPGR